MNVYRRYFKITSGNVIDALLEAEKHNAEMNAQLDLIIAEVGALSKYRAFGRQFAAFIFPPGHDTSGYVKRHEGYYPRKSNPIYSRVGALKWKNGEAVLSLVGLSDSPTIFARSKAYFPQCVFIPSEPPVAYVVVPWYDQDPAVLESYKAERATGNSYDATLDALLWTPPAEAEEVKCWQFEKAVDEWNASIKTK